MTDKSIAGIATMLEETFPSAYLRKNHNGLVSTLMCYLAPYRAEDAVAIIRGYAEEYDNAPNVGTIVKLLKKRAEGAQVRVTRKYIEDDDGCGYLYNEQTHEYDCIWKWWWGPEKGMSKMAVLRQYGLARDERY